MSMLHTLVVAALPHVPRPLMRRVASRYIAGERLEDALGVLRRLAGEGHPGILDILGEDVEDERAAHAVVADYCRAADAIAAEGLDAYVSIKPTHLGLRLSENLALALYREIARHCEPRGIFVRVEMEDHTTTDATLRIFEALREEFEGVGIVLQSRLHRTPRDIERLRPGRLSVRMVKGIYLEPPEIAYTDPQPIRDAFVHCTRMLLDRGAQVAFATHDERMGDELIALARERHLGRDAWEFQVLLGVQEPLWKRWHAEGHVVRVYVPYGPEWLPYSLRRLKHNPEILSHVMRAALRR